MSSRSAAENSNPLPDASIAPAREKSGDLKLDLLTALLDSGLKMSADAVQHSRVNLDGAELVFTTAKRFMLALRDSAVAKAASVLLGKPVKVRVEIDAAMSAERAPAIENGARAADIENEAAQRALTHPGVKRFQELFPGAHVRSVRNLNE
jgi:hypothetical protein